MTTSVLATFPQWDDGEASLVGATERKVRSMLRDGTFAAGAKINEMPLAARLGVSRTVLREAIRRLERSELVHIVPNRGVFVRQVGLREVLDLFDIHAGLARSAGRLLGERVDDDQVSRLEDCLARMRQAAKDGAAASYQDLNATFHHNLFAFTGNARLVSMHDGIVAELQLSRRRNLAHRTQLRASMVEHTRLVDAVRARDPGRAARAFEDHVLAGKRRIIETAVADPAD